MTAVTVTLTDRSGRATARATVSACIITRDEEQRLPDCLRSLAFCDEIVVVDSGSSDATVQIARAADAVVVARPWRGFAAQRNVAIDHARGEWILEVDADERVTNELRAEIEAFLAAPPRGVDLGGLPIRDIFLGRILGPSAQYPKYRHRLFRRGTHRHDEARTVHEGLIPEAAVHPFRGDLLHLLADDWPQALTDTWTYARLEAGQLEAPGTASGFAHGALARPAAKLIYRLVVDGGWRDGWRGVVKIGLECGGDSLVRIRQITGRRGTVRGRSGVPVAMHYGSFDHRRGNPRVVAVAAGSVAVARACEWLADARAAGADVVLIADARLPATGVRVHRVPGMRPLALIRALTAEGQLRPVDAVMAFGLCARGLLHAVPPNLRGAARATAEHVAAGDLVMAIAATRPGGATV